MLAVWFDGMSGHRADHRDAAETGDFDGIKLVASGKPHVTGVWFPRFSSFAE